MEQNKEEKKMTLDYAYGYRDALVDVWEDVFKMATKGYSSQEMQIVVKSKSYSSRKKIDLEIAELQAAGAPKEIIDAESEPAPLAGLEEPLPEIVIDLNPGFSYLVKEARPSKCFEIFRRELSVEHHGLCIARTSPSQIREKYGIGKSQIIWLTRSEKIDEHMSPASLGLGLDISGQDEFEEEYVDPHHLSKLYTIIVNFLDGNDDGVVLLEGIEYLLAHNPFNSVLNFVQKMNEHIVTSQAKLILSVDPSTMKPIEYSQIEREMSKTI